MLRLWLEHARNSTSNAHLFHAWEWLNREIHRDAELGFEAVMWLIARAPDDHVLELVGTGPLQHLLWQEPHFADRVIALAYADERFCRAALWAELDDEDVGLPEAERFDRAIESSPHAQNRLTRR